MNFSPYLFWSHFKIISEEMKTKTGLGNSNVPFVIVPLLFFLHVSKKPLKLFLVQKKSQAIIYVLRISFQ